MAALHTLMHYALQRYTKESIDQALANGLPLYGPNGLRRLVAGESVEAFTKFYFAEEFYLPFPDIHLRMLQDLQQIRDRQVAGMPGLKLARAIPRNHAKSTFYSRMLPLHGFLYGWSKLTVLLGNNDDAAKRLVGNIKTAIENNAAILQDFPEIKGNAWGSEKLEASNGAVVTSFGVGSGSIRGISTPARPSLVILDDVDDDRSVRSTVELANNIDWFDKAVMALGDNVSYTTSYIAVGTIIRKTSLMKYILDSADFDSVVEQRIKRWSSNVALWQEWESQYLELAKDGRQPKDASEDVFYQNNKSALLQDTEVLWDKQDEYYYAMVYRLARGTAAFNSEMQNTPEATNGTFGNVRFINPATINEDEYDLVCALDPTVTGNKTSDYAAYVEVLFNRKRKEAIVIYADVEQRSYSDTIDSIVKRMKDRKKVYEGFWIETNSAGAIILNLMTDRLRNEGIRRIPSSIYSRIPKTQRIAALSEYISRGQLYFADNLGEEPMREIETWPMSRHDDFLDACALVVHKLAELGMMDLIHIDTSPYDFRVI